MIPSFLVMVGPTRSGVSRKTESAVNWALNFSLGRLDTIAGYAREPNLQMVAFGTDGTDLYRLAGWLGRGNNRLGGEIERDTEHVSVLDVEQALWVEVVGLPAEGPADDLLAEKLGAEALTPSTWVTVLASQPSVSIETETTQRMDSPRRPSLPTVFMVSLSRSSSESFSAWERSPVRSTICRRNCSI